jgi:hypothetical protein
MADQKNTQKHKDKHENHHNIPQTQTQTQKPPNYNASANAPFCMLNAHCALQAAAALQQH